MIWFPARTRRILEKTADGRLKKAQAAQILSVSRKTIYKWLNRYIKLPRISRDKLTKEILAVVIANPSLGPKKIALILQKSFNNVSSGRIWQLLKENSLNTVKLRQDYALNYRLSTQAADLDHPRYLRLNSYTRKRMVEAVILGGAKVNQIVGAYHTSHKTFFKWKKRYLEAQSKDLTILPVMADKNPTGSEHPRGVDENTKQAVLSLVATVPNLSSRQISRYLGIIGNHGVQRVLERANLSRLTDRIRFAAEQKTLAKPSFPPTEERTMLGGKEFIPNLAPVPPPVSGAFRLSFRSVVITLSLLVIFSGILISWIKMLLNAGSFSQAMGLILATIALIVGTFFFLYSLKYYITLAIILSFSQQSLEVKEEQVETKRKGFLSWFLGIAAWRSFARKKRRPVGLKPNLDHVTLRRYPIISVHIPFYNEKNVVERAIAANTNFDYPEYEVILADDSKDSTTDIILNYLKKYGPPKITEGDGFTLAEVTVKPGVVLKHLHRISRVGFKGAALKLALQYTNPKAEFISIFDADFVPYPDTLTLFLKYFKEHNNLSEDYESTNVAAVQGYQWHVLNKSENWITRGVRTEYAGSYVIERSGTELYGGLKMIAGSVYMIRRKVLENIGWGVSITEDYELTLKLYEKGYKVVYTPYIQGPAECVSTLKRLIRQRMRWAEGHSFNTKIMFLRLLLNRNLIRAEKLEFLYLIPYYLQAFLFMVGTIAWLISETILRAKLPFWTSLWGWSLVLTNLIALPLVNIVGLFLEESEEKDYMGILSFVVLSYLVVPFQAYAALKGFLEKEEGTWFRTPKTGRVTDVFVRGRFYRLLSGIFTGVKPTIPAFNMSFGQSLSPYFALATANNRFNNFTVKPKRMRWMAKTFLVVLLIISLTLGSLAVNVKTAEAATQTLYLHGEASAVVSTSDQLKTAAADAAAVTQSVKQTNKAVGTIYQIQPGVANSQSAENTAYAWIYDTAESGKYATTAWTFYVRLVWASTTGAGKIHAKVYSYNGSTYTLLFEAISGILSASTTTTTYNFTYTPVTQPDMGTNTYLAVTYLYEVTTKSAANDTMTMTTDDNTLSTANQSQIQTSDFAIPETVLFLSPVIPFVPKIICWFEERSRKRKESGRKV